MFRFISYFIILIKLFCFASVEFMNIFLFFYNFLCRCHRFCGVFMSLVFIFFIRWLKSDFSSFYTFLLKYSCFKSRIYFIFSIFVFSSVSSIWFIYCFISVLCLFLSFFFTSKFLISAKQCLESCLCLAISAFLSIFYFFRAHVRLQHRIENGCFRFWHVNYVHILLPQGKKSEDFFQSFLKGLNSEWHILV